MKSVAACLLACTLMVGLFYLCTLLPAPAATSSVSQHISLDNHVNLTVVNNLPFDWSGVALLVIALAALVYVIRIVVQAFIELRRDAQERNKNNV